MKRVLMILTNLEYNDGVCSIILNYYRNINHDDFHFDFLIHSAPNPELLAEIEAHNDKVIVFPTLGKKNMKTIKKQAFELMKKEKYDIVHCNLPNTAFLYLSASKKAGVKVRIQHSHATKLADTKSHQIRNRILWSIGKRYVTTRLACSKAAGNFLYGKNPYFVLPNAIDFKKYTFSAKDRLEIRKQIGLSDNFILIGQIGRFCPQKNQLFSIKLMESLPKQFELLLIGTQNGEYASEVLRLAKNNPRIHVLSPTKDIQRYYSAMDCLILPSLFEGLPMTLVEAQANSLPCLVSANVTDEADFGSVNHLLLDSDTEWVKILMSSFLKRKETYSEFYDITKSVHQLEQEYLSLCEEANQ